MSGTASPAPGTIPKRSTLSLLYEVICAVETVLFLASCLLFAPLASVLFWKLFPSFTQSILSITPNLTDYIDHFVPVFVLSVLTEVIVSRGRENRKRRYF